MTTNNAFTARRSVRTACAGLACAMAVTSALAVATPAKAYAQSAGTKAAATRTATHNNGDSLIIKLSGRTIYANWYKINGAWWAVFKTNNGTMVRAKQSGSSWQLYAVNGTKLTPIVCTSYESTKVGKLGPKKLSSHFKAANANVWY